MRRRWVVVQGLFPFRRRSRFAALLGRPGFNPRHVRYEIEAAIDHGPAGATPTCRGDGLLALLVGRSLGWVVPPVQDGTRAGWIEAAWITGWEVDGAELVVRYQPPPLPVHAGGWPSGEVRRSEPQLLRITGDPAELVRFVDRAARVLSTSQPHDRTRRPQERTRRRTRGDAP